MWQQWRSEELEAAQRPSRVRKLQVYKIEGKEVEHEFACCRVEVIRSERGHCPSILRVQYGVAARHLIAPWQLDPHDLRRG